MMAFSEYEDYFDEDADYNLTKITEIEINKAMQRFFDYLR
jgi:hypothetical protein